MTQAETDEPRSAPPKAARMQLRVTDEQNQLIRDAASTSGETISSFVLASAVNRAQEVLADRRRFVVDAERWQLLRDALDRPVVLKARLGELLTEPSVLER